MRECSPLPQVIMIDFVTLFLHINIIVMINTHITIHSVHLNTDMPIIIGIHTGLCCYIYNKTLDVS